MKTIGAVACLAGASYSQKITLRSGSSYKLAVSAKDYLVGAAERLKPGKYEIRFIYRGKQSTYRDSTQMTACWEGEAQSNTLKIEVLAE